jgi:signal transduction histidine kinase
MVHMIVHDLRNPLSGLILGLQILHRGKYPAETLPQRLERLMYASQQLQDLIDDLLVMAKQEQGKICLDYHNVDLIALVTAVVKDYEAIADQKAVQLATDFSDTSLAVTLDSPIFHRILGNLLSNAIKFSPEHSQVLISVSAPTATTVKISILDQGPGVKESLKAKIFEPYEIGTIMPNVSQIGLGLAFCKMMIEAHGGAIAIEDNTPTGAILSLAIPRYPPGTVT